MTTGKIPHRKFSKSLHQNEQLVGPCCANKGHLFLGFGGVALGISIMILCKSTMVNDDGYYMVNIWLMMVNNISGWWLTYPSEK